LAAFFRALEKISTSDVKIIGGYLIILQNGVKKSITYVKIEFGGAALQVITS
jgi:hypothetical protein